MPVVDDILRKMLFALILVDIHNKASVDLHAVRHECQQTAYV